MKGLLFERMEWYERGGQSMIRKKCSRASYGIICEREYSKKKHEGQITIRNKFDNKLYVQNQIDWIIKKVLFRLCSLLMRYIANCVLKGQPVLNEMPIVHKFFLYREHDQPITAFSSRETIVRAGTNNPPDKLTGMCCRILGVMFIL